jgi:hypothetical protein
VVLVAGEGAEVAATAGPVVCGWGVAHAGSDERRQGRVAA